MSGDAPCRRTVAGYGRGRREIVERTAWPHSVAPICAISPAACTAVETSANGSGRAALRVARRVAGGRHRGRARPRGGRRGRRPCRRARAGGGAPARAARSRRWPSRGHGPARPSPCWRGSGRGGRLRGLGVGGRRPGRAAARRLRLRREPAPSRGRACHWRRLPPGSRRGSCRRPRRVRGGPGARRRPRAGPRRAVALGAAPRGARARQARQDVAVVAVGFGVSSEAWPDCAPSPRVPPRGDRNIPRRSASVSARAFRWLQWRARGAYAAPDRCHIMRGLRLSGYGGVAYVP